MATPIHLGSQWRFLQGLQPQWTSTSFDDSHWTIVTSGSGTEVVPGTQYFRQMLFCNGSYAAYELVLKFKFGLIAYIDGFEIVRENMAPGYASRSNVTCSPVDSTTEPTGNYSEEEYHTYYRSGSDLKSQSMVLAVELHFFHSFPQTNLTFDSYLQLLKPTVQTDRNVDFFHLFTACFIVSHTPHITVSGSGLSLLQTNNMVDFNRQTYWKSEAADSNLIITFSNLLHFIGFIQV